MRCNLPYIISHHRLAACEGYDKTRKCLCHIVKKRKTLLGFKLIRIRPESRRCPAVDAVQIARPCHFPCNELGKPFFLRGWFSLHPRNLMGMAFWHCMHNYLPSYSILKILLPRFALKNVPDTRRSKPPIETVGGRHTGDRFQICPQVERRSRSDNNADGRFSASTHYSSNVDISPGSTPSSFAFNTLRMILPLLVLGSHSVNSISEGMAIGPSSFLTCFFISSSKESDGLYPCFNITNAFMISPFNASGLPMHADSATA